MKNKLGSFRKMGKKSREKIKNVDQRSILKNQEMKKSHKISNSFLYTYKQDFIFRLTKCFISPYFLLS